jgi:hypothetical protein
MLGHLHRANAVLFWLGAGLVVGIMLWLWVALDQLSATDDGVLGSVLFTVLAIVWGVLPYALARWVAHLNRSSMAIQGVALASLLCIFLFQAVVYVLGLVVERDALSGLLLVVVPLYMLGGLVPLFVVWGWQYLRRNRGPA